MHFLVLIGLILNQNQEKINAFTLLNMEEPNSTKKGLESIGFLCRYIIIPVSQDEIPPNISIISCGRYLQNGPNGPGADLAAIAIMAPILFLEITIPTKLIPFGFNTPFSITLIHHNNPSNETLFESKPRKLTTSVIMALTALHCHPDLQSI
jgi:hypothetical protein